MEKRSQANVSLNGNSCGSLLGGQKKWLQHMGYPPTSSVPDVPREELEKLRDTAHSSSEHQHQHQGYGYRSLVGVEIFPHSDDQVRLFA